MFKFFSSWPCIDLGLPSGTCWHSRPAEIIIKGVSYSCISPYPEDDSTLPTYEQAQELINGCKIYPAEANSAPCFLIYGSVSNEPIIVPLKEEGSKFWVKSDDPTSEFAPFMFFTERFITIGMTSKTSECMALLPGEQKS